MGFEFVFLTSHLSALSSRQWSQSLFLAHWLFLPSGTASKSETEKPPLEYLIAHWSEHSPEKQETPDQLPSAHQMKMILNPGLPYPTEFPQPLGLKVLRWERTICFSGHFVNLSPPPPKSIQINLEILKQFVSISKKICFDLRDRQNSQKLTNSFDRFETAFFWWIKYFSEKSSPSP